MDDKFGANPAPLGAPKVESATDQAGDFLNGRPRLGGALHPLTFTDAQKAVIDAAADTLIPPGDGFPAPSEVGIADFIGRYVAPAGEPAKYFPFMGEEPFKAGLDRLGDGFVQSGEEERTTALKELEASDADYFDKLRALVYYGYYSTAEATLAIQKQIPAGRDYHGPPLPYGYLDCIEDWDEASLAAAGQGNGYIATEDVKRVDLSKVGWLNG